jgi:hypothetical protein
LICKCCNFTYKLQPTYRTCKMLHPVASGIASIHVSTRKWSKQKATIKYEFVMLVFHNLGQVQTSHPCLLSGSNFTPLSLVAYVGRNHYDYLAPEPAPSAVGVPDDAQAPKWLCDIGVWKHIDPPKNPQCLGDPRQPPQAGAERRPGPKETGHSLCKRSGVLRRYSQCTDTAAQGRHVHSTGSEAQNGVERSGMEWEEFERIINCLKLRRGDASSTGGPSLSLKHLEASTTMRREMKLLCSIGAPTETTSAFCWAKTW